MQQSDGVCPMCDWMMGWGWGTMFLVALLWLAAIGFVAWALYRFARSRGWIGGSAARRGSSEKILEERYARGEIGRDEYLRMREELRSDRS